MGVQEVCEPVVGVQEVCEGHVGVQEVCEGHVSGMTLRGNFQRSDSTFSLTS